MSKDGGNWQMVVFDFFGVLCSDLVDDWIRQRDLQSQATMLRDTYVRPADLGKLSFEDLCNGLGSSLRLAGVTVRDQLLDLAVVNSAAVDLFNELSANKKVAICSNAPRGLIDTVIAFRSMNLSCDVKVSSGDIGAAKPDAAPYLKVLDLAHCSAPSAIMIDDRAANVSGAEAIGMRGLQFTSVSHLRQQLSELGLSANPP